MFLVVGLADGWSFQLSVEAQSSMKHSSENDLISRDWTEENGR